MKKLMNRAEIEACRRIGRDEVNNRSCIALVELDALCDTALAAAADQPSELELAAHMLSGAFGHPHRQQLAIQRILKAIGHA